MKLSISNIAWNKEEDRQIAKLLSEFSIQGIDVSPTKIWDDPLHVSDESILQYQSFWNEKGIQIVALQSLHFGHPEFALFKDQKSRAAFLEHTKRMIELASKLGARALVFGSPKNRCTGNRDPKEVTEIAYDFFSELGEYAQKNNTHLCIEPNPKQYGTDFINTTQEAIALVKKIHCDGFKLNIDTSTLILNNENIDKTLQTALPFAGHFHISEPQLRLVPGANNNYHSITAQTLKKHHYSGWISIEMRSDIISSNENAIQQALHFVKETYL